MDTNSIPPARVLEPITSQLPEYEENGMEFPPKMEDGRAEWDKIFKKLSHMIRDAADIAVKEGKLTPESQLSFCKSSECSKYLS